MEWALPGAKRQDNHLQEGILKEPCCDKLRRFSAAYFSAIISENLHLNQLIDWVRLLGRRLFCAVDGCDVDAMRHRIFIDVAFLVMNRDTDNSAPR